jgi:hypothetical protein
LISNLPNPNIKVGLVTLYDFGTFYAAKSRLIQDILNNLKTKFQNRFDCFHVENGWSSEMTRFSNLFRAHAANVLLDMLQCYEVNFAAPLEIQR